MSPLKRTEVTHVRELNELEQQAVMLAMRPAPFAENSNLTITVGTTNDQPFVELHRKGNVPVMVQFDSQHEYNDGTVPQPVEQAQEQPAASTATTPEPQEQEEQEAPKPTKSTPRPTQQKSKSRVVKGTGKRKR